VDREFMVIIGIFIGSPISSLSDKSFKIEKIPPIWQKRFGSSIGKRAAGIDCIIIKHEFTRSHDFTGAWRIADSILDIPHILECLY